MKIFKKKKEKNSVVRSSNYLEHSYQKADICLTNKKKTVDFIFAIFNRINSEMKADIRINITISILLMKLLKDKHHIT